MLTYLSPPSENKKPPHKGGPA